MGIIRNRVKIIKIGEDRILLSTSPTNSMVGWVIVSNSIMDIMVNNSNSSILAVAKSSLLIAIAKSILKSLSTIKLKWSTKSNPIPTKLLVQPTSSKHGIWRLIRTTANTVLATSGLESERS